MQDVAERVRLLIEQEKSHPTVVTELDQVPPSYSSLTPEWLSKVLCASVADAKVADFTFGPPDDGSSNRRRIYITYNKAGEDAGLPGSVFCKAATEIDTRTVEAGMRGAEAEANFYNFVKPRLDIVTPDVLYAAHDPETYAYLIMMRDMGDEVLFPDDLHEMTRAQAESMVDALARLHSKFYQSPELGTATLPFRYWPEWWTSMMRISPGYAVGCDHAFGDSEHIMAPRLFGRRDEIWSKTMAAAAAHEHLPKSLIHSDVHLKNWFITRENQMGLHDWQVATIGHWSRDYIYAITVALTIEQRRAWGDDLLRLYLDLMASRGVAGLRLEDATRNCRQQLLSALSFWTVTLRPAPEMAEMQPERTSWTFLERFYAAIDDMDALDAF